MTTIPAQPLTILRIAVFPPAPLDRYLDYLPPARITHIMPGTRVKVGIGKRRGFGLVMECTDHTEFPLDRLREVEAVLDETPVISPDMLKLLEWTVRYYHCPMGQVLTQLLPGFFRQGKTATSHIPRIWFAHENADTRSCTPKQKQLYELLCKDSPISEQVLDETFKRWRQTTQALLDKGCIYHRKPAVFTVSPKNEFVLNADQDSVVTQIQVGMEKFSCHLLEGVTGSGKTEIYMQLVARALKLGRQSLVLVPEISLIPQTLRHFERRFGAVVMAFHSGMTETQRAQSWYRAYLGDVKIIVGTRSSVFIPFIKPGLIIVDEEHDPSYKQNDRLRYHARNLAVKRAQLLDIPVILGSATPSLESLRNALEGIYCHHQLTQRVGQASLPRYEVIDLCRQTIQAGLSGRLITMMRTRLERSEQVLLFLNRRGYAPKMLCHNCGYVIGCSQCDVPLTYHAYDNMLRCHHCEKSILKPDHCEQCGNSDLQIMGVGTEQIESELQSLFQGVGVVRIDADSVQQRGELEKRLAAARCGDVGILVGTQMLSKGHHFPNVTLTGIVNVDQRLFSSDFRGLEQLGQLIVQVAGRAGRGDKPGVVALQTHHPEHAELQQLLRNGYHDFAGSLLAARREVAMPPYQFLVLLNAEARDPDQSIQFLEFAARQINRYAVKELSVLGPTPMMMEKRRGFYRAQLLMSAPDRLTLNRILTMALPAIRNDKQARKVRWYLDIDPIDLE